MRRCRWGEAGPGTNVMYFETGQGSALSANANHGVDQQTIEARAYAVARHFRPLLVNTVVGFIGPEYLANGKQITRAGLEDHFCGKLLGLPMGCDVCYTNHADADADDTDTLLALLAAAGVTFVMGVPGADDIMLGYQSTSLPRRAGDARAVRPAPGAGVRGLAGRAGPAGRRRPGTAERAARPDAGAAAVTTAATPGRGSAGLTAARIGLPRSGAALATAPLLALRMAHAQAQDAVHAALDVGRRCRLALGPLLVVDSAAPDRADYLLRPDHGRRPGTGREPAAGRVRPGAGAGRRLVGPRGAGRTRPR